MNPVQHAKSCAIRFNSVKPFIPLLPKIPVRSPVQFWNITLKFMQWVKYYIRMARKCNLLSLLGSGCILIIKKKSLSSRALINACSSPTISLPRGVFWSANFSSYGAYVDKNPMFLKKSNFWEKQSWPCIWHSLAGPI